MDPVKLAHRAVTAPAEKVRRKLAQERIDLLYENTEHILIAEVGRIFTDATIRTRLEPFLRLAASPSLFSRTIHEVANPVYQVAPTRKVALGESRAADKEQTRRLRRLVDKVNLDCRMDLAALVGLAANAAFLLFRNDARLGCIVDVVTAADCTVLPDPADPLRELGFIYDRPAVDAQGNVVPAYAYVDDEETFYFSQHGQLLPHPSTGKIERVPSDIFPVVPIHFTERPIGQYWDTTSGNSLKHASIAASLITALALKLHKSAGFKQLVVSGDILAFPKDQALDEESALVAPEGTSISTLDLTSPATHYLATLDDIVRRMAANYGINLDRLNAKAGADASDAGLLERREDAIKVFRKAESRAFELLKAFSRFEPEYVLDPDGRLEIDFGEISLRTDPAGTLELWDRQISMGLRNELDNVRALNPEIDSDEEAWDEFERNLTVHARAIEMMRALNMTQNAQPSMPGQDPQANGAMGPPVRDGEMTKDEAAAKASGSVEMYHEEKDSE